MQYNFGRNLDELKLATIVNINKTTYDKITSEYPIWKQVNLNTRALELVILGNKISNEEKLELANIQLVFKYINVVRAISNICVDEINTSTCPLQIRQKEIDSIEQIKNMSKND